MDFILVFHISFGNFIFLSYLCNTKEINMTRAEINERAGRYSDCIKESIKNGSDIKIDLMGIIRDVANTESNRIYEWIRTNLGNEAAKKFMEADI